MSPIADRDRYVQHYHRARECFLKAARLFEPVIEPIEVSFEGHQLPGYFIPSDTNQEKGKTLIMIGGGDTFVEDLYGYIGPAASRRGYHLLIVDLPGQGLLPDEGLIMRPDMEAPFTAVVDYALSRQEVDPERLATYGISGGGYIVPRAVTREKRIRACVACSLLLDLSVVWNRRYVDLHKKARRSLLYRIIKDFIKRRRESYFTMVDTYVWRWGAESVIDLVDISRSFTVDPAQITCPTLDIVAEQEFVSSPFAREFARRCLTEINHPRREVFVTPANEGADSHAIGTNLSLMSQVVFDWLDESLG